MEGSVCVNHPEREAVVQCTSCMKPICEECIIQLNGKNYCSNQCAEGAVEAGQRLDTLAAADRRVKMRKLIRRVIILVILLAIAAGVAWWVLKNPEQSKGLLDQAKEMVDKQEVEPPK